jgi:uncharacterized OB-fold protein
MIDTETAASLAQEWYDGLAAGVLLVQRCRTCDQPILYPKYRCPACFGDDLGWEPASGRGRLHSFTVTRAGSPSGFEDDIPYAVAVVKLEEGVQLLGRLRPDSDGTWDSYRCDDAVIFSPRSTQEGSRPTSWFEAFDAERDGPR